MKRVLFWFSATDTDVIKHCTARARNLQQTLGAMVLFTGVMAYISGSYAIYTFSHSFQVAMIGGAIYAFGIIQFDRFIVSSSNKYAVAIRVPLAIIIGLAVSLPLETFVLKERIDKQLTEDNREENHHLIQKRDSVIEDFDLRTKKLDSIVRQEEIYQEEWSRAMQEEVVGKVKNGRTGKAGVGPAYEAASRNFDLHTKLLAVARTDRNDHTSKRSELLQQLKDEYSQQKVDQAYDLLARVEALEKIKSKSGAANRIAWLLRILFIMFEVFPAVAKFFLDQNDYFTLIEARDKLNQQQTNVQANSGMKAILENPHTFDGAEDPSESYLTRIKKALMR